MEDKFENKKYAIEEIHATIDDLILAGEILVTCPHCDSYLSNEEYNDLFCQYCNNVFRSNDVKCYKNSTNRN